MVGQDFECSMEFVDFITSIPNIHLDIGTAALKRIFFCDYNKLKHLSIRVYQENPEFVPVMLSFIKKCPHLN